MQVKRNYHGLSVAGVFYRDRDEWMRHLAGRTDYDASTRMVGIAIALYTNPKSREAYPQQKTIARNLGLSIPTVKRAVALLAKDKILSVKLKRRKDAKRAVNHYSLIHPADQVSPLIPD